MSDFENSKSSTGFTFKLWRGERMCLLGFDVAQPEPDLVGFAIEVREPGSTVFEPLNNRLAFSYDKPAGEAVTGARLFPSTRAPFQRFRWIHFPHEPRAGKYTYRATKMHMPQDDKLVRGKRLSLDLSLDPITHADFVDVGFTRNFASSQAFQDRFPETPNILPARADDGLAFSKGDPEIYRWLGFEAHDLIFQFLQRAVDDPSITLDVLAYDLNEPDIVARLRQLGKRLRVVIDDSSEVDGGVVKGHGAPDSAESQAAALLKKSAGASRVKRTHFRNLQHHKVLIARRNGQPFEVLVGSTNFSFRGIYVQSNNVLVFRAEEVARFYGQVFDAAFKAPSKFAASPLAATWHLAASAGKPTVHLCFSPHQSPDLALNPVRAAIDQATSSVLYSVAFLNQIKGGPTKAAFDRLITRPVFSYGVVNERGNLAVKKPDGSTGLVDFAFLADNAPQPFKREWSGGRGINVHHKFVVTDFSLPTAKVFTGSSNLAPSGESNNGDHLIMIEDRKIAQGYAIEAVRVFDHLHFRSRMQNATGGNGAGNGAGPPKKADPLKLRKPRAISGKPAWFEGYYTAGTQRAADRQLFAGTKPTS